MAVTEEGTAALPPVDRTLTWVVLIMRLLGWVWMVLLTIAALSGAGPDVDRLVLIGAIVLGTLGTSVTVLAVRREFLGASWYPIFDGALTMLLGSAGWLAGYSEFITGGYPMSWLFVVAYSTGLRWTMVAGVIASGVFAILHVLMGLETVRLVGSIQFIVVAAVVGWAFEALRQREALQLMAEANRARTERELVAEREQSARLRERSEIGRQLHDSVLQTLKLISGAADDPAEVRFLARVQERDLRRTISEYQSPYQDSFRARLLDARAMVEDRYRISIEQVIRDDAEMDPRLQTLVEAATEALTNAARHSGSPTIDLYAAVLNDGVQINIRDRGDGFDPGEVSNSGISHSIVDPVVAVGGTVEIKTRPNQGTEIALYLPTG